MEKELSVNMNMYMQYEGEYSKDELENRFYKLIEKFSDENGMCFSIHDSEIQEI